MVDESTTEVLPASGTIGPIIFSNEQARCQLLEGGEVYTFRSSERTTGETWARKSRTGPKIADVTVEEVCSISTPQEHDFDTEWVQKSGFGTAERWLNAIEDIHGDVTDGYIYRCTLRDGDA